MMRFVPSVIRRYVSLVVIVVGVTACDSTPVPSTVAPASTPAPAASTAAPAVQRFGGAIGDIAPTELTQVLEDPDRFADQTVLVQGLVRRACSRKGCWMELGRDTAGPGCRVTFKDYGFFVPKDSAGSQAKVQAVVESHILEPKDVRHYEREGAQFANKAEDGSVKEVRLVASGVELWR